jgi:hypothetical protein
VTVTFDPVPALWTAGAAALIGLGAAAGASRFGSTIILESAGAKRADETGDRELVDVVRELSLAANIPPPTTYVIEDGSQNAFATGRDPEHASVAVTRGLLDRMDREELQGVIGHELGHVRNLDTRYALYVAVLVGIVAIVTDGFLRVIVEAWRHGAFYWKGEGKNAAAALVAGLCVGIFLLIIAACCGSSRRSSRRSCRPRPAGSASSSPTPPRSSSRGTRGRSSGRSRRSPRTPIRSRPRTAAPNTSGSATRSRAAATAGPASSRHTPRWRHASSACGRSRASPRSIPKRRRRRPRKPEGRTKGR